MARCLTPIQKQVDGATYQLPCGRCINCQKRRTSHWSFRLMQQDKKSVNAYFVTLTYDTDSVPLSPNGFMNLEVSDLQKFMKRLRKLNKVLMPPGQKIKYYAVGEYGGKSKRPHYHLIMFNVNPDTIEDAWSLNKKPIGSIHIGDVSAASVGYTLKYISKGGFKRLHKNDDRLPEFSVMSKGLGLDYLSPTIIRYHKLDPAGRCYLVVEDGKKISMPRYYKERLFDHDELGEIKLAMTTEIQEDLDSWNSHTDFENRFYNLEQAIKAQAKHSKFKAQKNDKI